MQKILNVLQLIFYLIWIPLGVLLLIVIIFLIMNNPLRSLDGLVGGLPPAGFQGQQGGGFSPPGGVPSGVPSEDMMKQYIQQGQGMLPAGQFGPKSGQKQ